MNEPHMAPWWFPANDHPRDKALIDIQDHGAQRPRGGLQRRAARRTVGARSTQWHWRADEPMVPYLAFFAAGRLRGRQGQARRPAVARRGLEAAWPVAAAEASDAADEEDPAVVAGLEKDLGDYPFSVVGGLVTGLNPGFALENQTRPTYPGSAAAFSLVVHELAHQWFGDSVAVERWRDIWLNEGFATFMECSTLVTGGGIGDAWLIDTGTTGSRTSPSSGRYGWPTRARTGSSTSPSTCAAP